MKKQSKLKSLILSFALVTTWMFPTSLFAQQTDYFISNIDESDMRLAEIIISGGLDNQIFGQAPVGSGLLVMVAAGAGYALVRRKRHNNKSTTLLLAFTLLLGMTQCKKNVETITPIVDNSATRITLNVDHGSRHVVNPNTGEVTFENGMDYVLVGNNGKFVGYLDYDGTNFVGDINPSRLTEGEYLYFYFISGLGTSGLNPGDETWVVNISNQSQDLLVLSCGRSNVRYQSDVNTYSSTLLNKCALVNFHFINEMTSSAVISNMLVSATVDFANNDIVPTPGAATGSISLRGYGSRDKWAVILPNEEAISATVTAGGKTFAVEVPAVEPNDYLTYSNGNAVMIGHEFSVSASKKVVFSPGNLQYKSGEGWKFADNQYDYIGSRNPSNWVDLFGYGTWTGSDPNPLNMSTVQSQYTWDDADFVQMLTNNGETGWFTLSSDEWAYMFNSRDGAATKQGAATVHGKNGLILLPDKWSGDAINSNLSGWSDNTPTDAQWTDMESKGAVFLPAAGHNDDGYYVDTAGTIGAYWSSTIVPPYHQRAYGLDFGTAPSFEVHACDGNNMFLGLNVVNYGQSVRLVR